MSYEVQQRTLVVRNFGEQTTKELLNELFVQAGPVTNVVLRPDHAFVEFEHIDSVGYAMALMDGLTLFDERLQLSPKLYDDQTYYQHQKSMDLFNNFMRFNPDHFLQFMSEEDQKRVKKEVMAEIEAQPRHQTHRYSDGYQYSGANRYSDGYQHSGANRYSNGHYSEGHSSSYGRHSDGHQFSQGNRYSDANRYSNGGRYQSYDSPQQYSRHNHQPQYDTYQTHQTNPYERQSYDSFNSRKRHSYPSW